MNYYNPYFIPVYMKKASIFQNLFKGFNISSIISGTQKTLNLVNQAIPIVKELSPALRNVKAMFKIVSEINKPEKGKDTHVNETSIDTYQEGPTFFK